jgi:hypothetical protein
MGIQLDMEYCEVDYEKKKKNKQRHVGGGCYCYLQYRWRFCLCERMNEVVFVPCFILLLREYIYFYTQNQIF